VLSAAATVLAVDDPRLVGVKPQANLLHPRGDPATHVLRVSGGRRDLRSSEPTSTAGRQVHTFAQEPGPRSRHLHAGHRLASRQAPARLIPSVVSAPGFYAAESFRHLISGSLALAFVIHTCRAFGRDVSRDAQHHGS
jgi:hypothetical protein